MPSLNSTELGQLEAKIPAAFEDFDYADASDYYDYLENKGFNYGTLAKGVVENNTLSGEIANNYLERYMAHEGQDFSYGSENHKLLMYELMKADYDAREDNEGNELDRNDYTDIHNSANDAAGSARESWTAYIPLENLADQNPTYADNAWSDLVNNPNAGIAQLIAEGIENGLLMSTPTSGGLQGVLDSYIEQARYFGDALGSIWDSIGGQSGVSGLEGELPRQDFPGFWGPFDDLADLDGQLPTGIPELPTDWLGNIPPPEEIPPMSFPAWWETPAGQFSVAPWVLDPLILDLDGDGVEVTELVTSGAEEDITTTFFDIDNDGFAEQTAWVGADDGLLVRDINENDIIDDASELFGTSTVDGFSILQQLDSNGDLLINSADTDWGTLKVWGDANSNAITDDGELHTLASLDITGFRLNDIAASTSTINGNRVSQTSTYMLENGTSRTISDVWFNTEQGNSYNTEDYTFDIRAAFLPSLRGFGNLKPLHQAMSEDEGLLDMVADLVANYGDAAVFSDPDGFDTALTDVLNAWAGVTGPLTNRPEYLQFMEAFFGRAARADVQNITGRGWFALEEIYIDIFAALKGAIIAQLPIGQEMFDGTAYYNVWTGQVEGAFEISEEALDNLVTASTASGVDTEAFWVQVGHFISASKGFENVSGGEETLLDDALTDASLGHSWADIEDIVDIGTHGYDTFNGTSGNDTLNGAGTYDTISGLAGNDTISGLGGHDTIYGGSGDDTISAGSGDDLVHADSDNDTIDGGAGNDELYGEDGNDTLTGGADGDIVYGGAGNDVYTYTSGDDLFSETGGFGNNGTDKIVFPSGITSGDISFVVRDVFSLFITVGTLGTIEVQGQVPVFSYMLAGYNQIETLEFADTSTIDLTALDNLVFEGTEAADTLRGRYGTSGDDILYGFGGDDHLTPGDGDDTLDGGMGNDALEGAAGNDTYIFSPGFDFITENGGTDVIILPEWVTEGDIFISRLFSAANPNGYDMTILVAGLGQLTVGAHFFHSSNGVETLIYGENGANEIDLLDIDILSVGTTGDNSIGAPITNASDNNFYDAREGADNISDSDGGDDVYVQSIGVDTITDTGGGTDEFHFLAGITVGQITISRASNNMLVYVDAVHTATLTNHYTSGRMETFRLADNSTYSTPVDSITGTTGNDTINGTAFSDVIHGLAGNDTINAGAGNDSIYGNAGDDVIDGGDGVDTAYYTTGVAYINLDLGYAAGTDGEGGLDTITNVENIVGSAYDDFIDGNSSNNTLWGGAGGDVITGYTGDDILYGEDGADYLWGNEGNDTLYGGAGNDPLYGLEGNDTLYGGDGNDTLRGDDANSASNFTGAGNDVLYGGVGNDVMAGGAGNDILWGDDGVDTMYGNAGDDIFAYNSAALNTTSHDIISDFALADDVLDLSDIMTNYVSGTSDVDDYVKTVSIASTHTRIQVDIDGTGTTYTWMNLAQIQNINTTTFGPVENAVTNGIIVL